MTKSRRHVRTAPAARKDRPKSRVARGRVILLVVLGWVVANELVGLGATGVASGSFSPVQGMGLMAALAGSVFVFVDAARARWALVLVLVALGAYGIVHLVGVPHDVNLHSVLLGVQSVIRLGAAAVLLGSKDVRAFCGEARRTTRQRGHG